MSESRTLRRRSRQPAGSPAAAACRARAGAGADRAVAGVERLGSSCGAETARRRCSSRATWPRSGPAAALQQQTGALPQRLASAPVQAALRPATWPRPRAQLERRLGRHVEAARSCRRTWMRPMPACRRRGFGKLAVAEAALADDKPVARIVKDGGGPRLASPRRRRRRRAGRRGLCAPAAGAGDRRASQAANVGDDSYLALRQGNYTVLETRRQAPGRRRRSAGAPRCPAATCASPPACPTRPAAPFGLGAIPSFIAAAGAARPGSRSLAGARAAAVAAAREATADAGRGDRPWRRRCSRAPARRARAAPRSRARPRSQGRPGSRSTAASSAPTTSAASSARRSTPASPN